jgi:hypothetical protein
MSFLRRLVLAISLLVLLGVPLSAMYYDPARSLPAGADEERLVQQDDGTPAGEKASAISSPREPREEKGADGSNGRLAAARPE